MKAGSRLIYELQVLILKIGLRISVVQIAAAPQANYRLGWAENVSNRKKLMEKTKNY